MSDGGSMITDPGCRSCLSIAHRGASKEAPENTMAAFRRAVEIGAEMIELDVQRTREGVLVVMHDEDVRRTTNGRGFVRQLLLDDLRQLDAGSWFSTDFAGEPVPMLEEVCALTAGRVALNIEVKCFGADSGLFAETLLSYLQRFDLLSTSLVSCFDQGVLTRLRRSSRDVRLAFLYHAILVPATYDELAELNLTALHPNHALLNRRLVERLHGLGVAVNTWTVDNPRRMAKLMDWGVDGIITNNLAGLKNLVTCNQSDTPIS